MDDFYLLEKRLRYLVSIEDYEKASRVHGWLNELRLNEKEKEKEKT